MSQQKWPGYHADGEAARLARERQMEQRIKASLLSGRIQAAFQPDRIDRSIGRTFADASARGMYDPGRVADFREECAEQRAERERFRWRQVRMQGRMGRN